MSSFTVRPYRSDDEQQVLGVWNAAMWADPIDAPGIRRTVLLDPNCRPEGLQVAETGAEIAGFMLALHRRVPNFRDGLQTDQAWITAFGVLPRERRQGIGQRLLDASLAYVQGEGARVVRVAPYIPNYVIPGVDVAAYPEAVALLERNGFAVTSRPLSMRADLTGFRIPEPIAQTAERLAREDIMIRPAVATDIPDILDFAARLFSWDWWSNAADVLGALFAGGASRGAGMWVAYQDGRLLGYSMHRAERFGPFGVDPALRSRGIGRVLLAETLLGMRRQQFHAAWFLWTSDNAARLYAQCGFREVRRFAMMEKQLG